MKAEGKSKDFSNGPEAAAADRQRKRATAPARGSKQPKGKAESGAKARYSSMKKAQKFSEDVEF